MPILFNVPEIKKTIVHLYKKFCGYVIETNPNYTDSDFSFENFMDYLQMEETDDLRHAQ